MKIQHDTSIIDTIRNPWALYPINQRNAYKYRVSRNNIQLSIICSVSFSSGTLHLQQMFFTLFKKHSIWTLVALSAIRLNCPLRKKHLITFYWGHMKSQFFGFQEKESREKHKNETEVENNELGKQSSEHPRSAAFPELSLEEQRPHGAAFTAVVGMRATTLSCGPSA